jgi:hypothetical protein
MRCAVSRSSRAQLICHIAIQGGFHELHNEPEFKDGLIAKAIEWTLKHIDTPSQTGSSSQGHPIPVVETLPDGVPADGGADKPKL